MSFENEGEDQKRTPENPYSCVWVFMSAICVPVSGQSNPASEHKMLEDITKLLLSEISKLSSRITFLEQQK
jgi:hypothetical protein